MERDEVLRRIQDKKPNVLDEMEQDILNKGCKVGVIAGFIACIAAMIVKMIAGLPYYDVYAIYCFIASGQWFYKWIRLRRKYDLCYGILWFGMAVGLFIGYLVEIF